VFYLALKAAHVVSVIVFVGGLIAQSLAVANLWMGTGHLHLAVERWDRRVTTPAMLATWLFGMLLAMQGAFFSSGWLVAKLMIVVALSGLHGIQAGLLRRSLIEPPAATGYLQTLAPKVVTGGVILIVTLVVIKPF